MATGSVKELAPAAIERHAEVRACVYVRSRHTARAKREGRDQPRLKYQLEAMHGPSTVKQPALEDRRGPTQGGYLRHQNG
jgi:hypothetical protein